MDIRAARPEDLDEWLRMRRALWPDADAADLRAEVSAYGANWAPSQLGPTPDARSAVLVAVRAGGGGLGGFVETQLRDVAEGAVSSPVGFVEGWWVDPDLRRQGIGRALVRAAEAWARARGCREMGSDTDLDNVDSQRAHAALGYRETARLVAFLKPL